MNGKELREARAELHWTRQQLIENLGDDRAELTAAKIANIESDKRKIKPNETKVLKQLLLRQLGRVITEEVEAIRVAEDEAITVSLPQGSVSRLYEWNGLRPQDRVRIKGKRGSFKFLYYQTDGNGIEHVELYGGTPWKHKEQSVTPDKIILPHH